MPARILTRGVLAAAALAGCSLDASGVGSAGPAATTTSAPTPAPDTSADAGAASSSAPPAPLLGDDAIEPSITTISPGLADAFAFAAREDGHATHVAFYVDASSTIATTDVGVYDDLGRGPGALLASARVTPARGAWTTVALSTEIALRAGQRLWIAVLGSGAGALAFRTGGGQSGSQALPLGLASLPPTWGPGAPTVDGPASAYLF